MSYEDKITDLLPEEEIKEGAEEIDGTEGETEEPKDDGIIDDDGLGDDIGI